MQSSGETLHLLITHAHARMIRILKNACWNHGAAHRQNEPKPSIMGSCKINTYRYLRLTLEYTSAHLQKHRGEHNHVTSCPQ